MSLKVSRVDSSGDILIDDGYGAGSDESSSEEIEVPFGILMPKFNYQPESFFRQVENIISLKLAKQLASQRLKWAPDQSGAFYHDSTYSPAYSQFTKHMGLIHGYNMDSGAILQRLSEGTNSACIVDGISSEGFASAFAAHLFAQLLIEKIAIERPSFTEDVWANKELVLQIFSETARLAHKQLDGASFTKFGAAPLGFVDCRKLDDRRYKVISGALGDIVIYHFSHEKKECRQINTIQRAKLSQGQDDLSDPAGWISTDGKVYRSENVSAHEIDIDVEDIMLLASDGLYDNLHPLQRNEILAFIITNPIFDLPLPALKALPRTWYTSLPMLDALQRFAERDDGAEQPHITSPTVCVKRVNSYLRLLHLARYEAEEKKYKLLIEASLMKSSMPEYAVQLEKQAAKIAVPEVPGKLDDIMLVAIRPSFAKGS